MLRLPPWPLRLTRCSSPGGLQESWKCGCRLQPFTGHPEGARGPGHPIPELPAAARAREGLTGVRDRSSFAFSCAFPDVQACGPHRGEDPGHRPSGLGIPAEEQPSPHRSHLTRAAPWRGRRQASVWCRWAGRSCTMCWQTSSSRNTTAILLQDGLGRKQFKASNLSKKSVLFYSLKRGLT